MAERRSIYKKITTSEPVSRLSDLAKLFFTWSIPYADDIGVLPFSSISLKGKIFPLIDCDVGGIDEYVKEIIAQKLYIPFTYDNKPYLFVKGFFQHQTLKKDRQPQTILPIVFTGKVSESWDVAEKELNKAISENGIHLETIGIHLDTEVKGSEGKGSEEKRKEIISTAGRAVNDLINLFEPINPSYERLFSNKTQRSALERLIKKFGTEKIKSTIEALPALINKPYAPTITTPIQLESKLGSLISFYYKQKNNKTTIIGL